MTTRALYCPALCSHPVRYDDSTFWWMRAQQDRQARVLWRDWALKSLTIAEALALNSREFFSFYDISVIEFPGDAVERVVDGHKVWSVPREGGHVVEVLTTYEAFGKAIQRSMRYYGRKP